MKNNGINIYSENWNCVYTQVLDIQYLLYLNTIYFLYVESLHICKFGSVKSTSAILAFRSDCAVVPIVICFLHLLFYFEITSNIIFSQSFDCS